MPRTISRYVLRVDCQCWGCRGASRICVFVIFGAAIALVVAWILQAG